MKKTHHKSYTHLKGLLNKSIRYKVMEDIKASLTWVPNELGKHIPVR